MERGGQQDLDLFLRSAAPLWMASEGVLILLSELEDDLLLAIATAGKRWQSRDKNTTVARWAGASSTVSKTPTRRQVSNFWITAVDMLQEKKAPGMKSIRNGKPGRQFGKRHVSSVLVAFLVQLRYQSHHLTGRSPYYLVFFTCYMNCIISYRRHNFSTCSSNSGNGLQNNHLIAFPARLIHGSITANNFTCKNTCRVR